MEVCPLKTWKCWLFRQSPTTDYPTAGLNMFLSLANDACRALDLRDCGEIIDGRLFEGKRGEFQHLLRWAIEQLPAEECEKLTWLDPPHQHVRTTLRPGHTPSRWVVEMPCAFAAWPRHSNATWAGSEVLAFGLTAEHHVDDDIPRLPRSMCPPRFPP